MGKVIKDVAGFRSALLEWYDREGRTLPWRHKGGAHPDPYHVWLSEIMLQQTTVPTVIPYFSKFIARWPDIRTLAAADQEDVLGEWAGLGYYARGRNLHKCARVLMAEYNGIFPETEPELLALPGIGPYTAAAIRAIAFDKPANVVDGNVERVMARLFEIETAFPEDKQIAAQKAGTLILNHRSGDYAQALMDLGANICMPRIIKCESCPLTTFCHAYASKTQFKYPILSIKAAKPTKYGVVYVLKDDKNRFILQKRSQKGLFGGMYGFYTTEFVTDPLSLNKNVRFNELPIEIEDNFAIKHVFTHFTLYLHIATGKCITIPEDARVFEREEFISLPLPTLFKKVRASAFGNKLI